MNKEKFIKHIKSSIFIFGIIISLFSGWLMVYFGNLPKLSWQVELGILLTIAAAIFITTEIIYIFGILDYKKSIKRFNVVSEKTQSFGVALSLWIISIMIFIVWDYIYKNFIPKPFPWHSVIVFAMGTIFYICVAAGLFSLFMLYMVTNTKIAEKLIGYEYVEGFRDKPEVDNKKRIQVIKTHSKPKKKKKTKNRRRKKK